MTNRDDIALVRQEHLQNLGRFCRALSDVISSHPQAEGGLSSIRAAITGECVACGIQVSGEELLAAGRVGEVRKSNHRVERLQQGYCARAGCDSFYYQLTFARVAELDWAQVLALADAEANGPDQTSTDEAAGLAAAVQLDRRQLARRVVFGLGVILLILIARQWYVGGTIPLIRQPEDFRVDPVSAGYEFSE